MSRGGRRGPSRRWRWVTLTLAVAAVGGSLWWLGAGEDRRPPGGVRATVAVAAALGGDTAGYARAREPRPLAFPADHGPHGEFRTEWWYYTGNLRATDGRPFGFQLTFFRHALVPGGPEPSSGWRTTQLYLAHFAVTDVSGGRFHAHARTSRAALGLAGARAQPFRVWLEDWVAEGAGPTALPMRLVAAAGEVGIDLILDSAKPPVLQGERGLSRKGPEPGNASHYYSLTRMPARGTVTLKGVPFAVEGLAWMDREWSTSALGRNLVGWDWFALQLADGREVMYYQLRRRDGTADAWSAGVVVERDGATRTLRAEEVRLEALDTWVSPRSGARYPARWRLVDRAGGLVLYVTPRLADQELLVGTRYWEGACAVTGTDNAGPLQGEGYVELVGYGEEAGR